MSARSRRYWPAEREWNRTLKEEGFYRLGARSLMDNIERSIMAGSNIDYNRSDFSVRAFPTGLWTETTGCSCEGHVGRPGVLTWRCHCMFLGVPACLVGKDYGAVLGSSLRGPPPPLSSTCAILCFFFVCSSVLCSFLRRIRGHQPLPQRCWGG